MSMLSETLVSLPALSATLLFATVATLTADDSRSAFMVERHVSGDWRYSRQP
jgi:hypothetical protein